MKWTEYATLPKLNVAACLKQMCKLFSKSALHQYHKCNESQCCQNNDIIKKIKIKYCPNDGHLQNSHQKTRATLTAEKITTVDILIITALVISRQHLHYIQKSSNTKSKHLCYLVCYVAVISIVKSLSKPQATTTRNDALVVN